jgi:peptidoglycan/LPS O-acetylase OafA/YrhL
MRLFAAVAVFISHVFMITHCQRGTFLSPEGLGLMGVKVFFTISGFLVAKSWAATENPAEFARNRFLRIFPGLLAVVSVSVFVLGPLLTTFQIGKYFTNSATYAYLLNAFFWGPQGLPGTLVENGRPGLVNGCLWTLPYECSLYAVLAVCGVCGRHGFNKAILLAYSIMLVGSLPFVRFAIQDYTVRRISGQFFEFGMYFFAGAIAWCFRERIVLRGYLVALFGLTILLRSTFNLDGVVVPILAPYLILWAGLRNAPYWTAKIQRNDYSYGIYIWGFPIQKATESILGDGFFPNLVIAGTATFACATLSWHWIEKPSMKLKKRSSSGVELSANPVLSGGFS